MEEARYEEAQRVLEVMWPELHAIAYEVHPDGCLESDGAAQWLSSIPPFLYEYDE